MAGTVDLVKGLLKGFLDSGFQIGGFDAYITSNVISAAGVSSSASFEMLLCSILNTFFKEGRMNTPGVAAGNWNWRFRQDALTKKHAKKLKKLSHLYGR